MTQDIKTAFFDIDGTLTSFVTHVVPQSTIDALHALQRNGVKVFICSGRAPSYMGVVLDTIPVTFDGIVGLNGQYCTTRDGLDYRHPIDQADVKLITDWLETHADVVANYAESDYGPHWNARGTVSARPRRKSTCMIRANASQTIPRSKSARMWTRRWKPKSPACAATCAASDGIPLSPI